METDLGTRLDWVAVDHWNTDNPHTHVVLRGKNELGKDLIIARDYIAHGMRQRAAALATEWLGPRTELEIRQALGREVTQERWTSLDRTLQREATEGQLTPAAFARPHLQAQRQLLVGRLQHLQRMGLAAEATPGTWALQPDAEPTLRALGERGDIIRTLQRAMGGQRRELAIHTTGQAAPVPPVILGRVAAKGLADELNDNGYLVIDSTDGKAHYLPLPARTELEQFPLGGIVEARSNQGSHAADRNIAALAVDGIYRTDHHLAVVRGQGKTGSHAQGTVTAHVRRLEALRCAGIVERVAEGVWRVPGDLAERGRQYDAQRLDGDVAVDLKSHLPIDRQARVIGSDLA
jgi:type IV secretory pathway VirD2 relaxase